MWNQNVEYTLKFRVKMVYSFQHILNGDSLIQVRGTTLGMALCKQQQTVTILSTNVSS
jgi:hypothetical protein